MQIIVTNNLSERKTKKYVRGRVGFISFIGYDKARDVFLGKYEHIDLREIIIASRSSLRRSVIEFGGKLNSYAPHNNWWAIGLSRRVAMYPFWNSLAKLFIIREIIDTGKWDTCLVYDDSICPWNYIKDKEHQVKVNIRTNFSITTDWKFRTKKILPVSMLLGLCRRLITKAILGIKSIENKKKPLIVLFTLIDRNNFDKKGNFRDVYLGELSNHLDEEGYDIFTLGQLHDEPSSHLFSNIKNKRNSRFALLDHFWSPKDLYIVAKEALKDYFSKPPLWPIPHFAGFDVRGVFNVNLKLDLQAGYLDNLLDCRAAKICFEQIQPYLFIYPYENKCIEHMLLKAIQEVSPATKTIGYQHAVLTPKHIHMFLAEGESDTLPLPTKLMTNGRHTANLLHEQGNYPDQMIVTGTALRQTVSIPENLIKEKSPRKIEKVLMALAEGREEYDKAIEFMRNIQTNNKAREYDFRVRLHPGIPYDPFQNEKIMRKLRCTKDTNPSLLESLYWADVVLYASTSVAVQAMMMGIPVIWMDLLDFWGADPINKNDVLQWKLDSAEGWNHVITTIEQLSCNEFRQRMENTKRFVSDYFCYEPFDIKRWLKYA